MTQKPFFKFLRKSNSVHCGKSFKPLESSPWFAFKVRHWLQSFLSFWGCHLACQCLHAWKQLAHGKYPGYFCQFLSSDCACWRYLLLSDHLHIYCFPYIACSNVHRSIMPNCSNACNWVLNLASFCREQKGSGRTKHCIRLPFEKQISFLCWYWKVKGHTDNRFSVADFGKWLLCGWFLGAISSPGL